MRLLRRCGVTLVMAAVIAVAAGAAYAVRLGRLWTSAVRSTDPFDPAEPI